MAVVLPGERILAEHDHLKLGPGLLQLSILQGTGPIISTRAGVLHHAPNKRKWWVENNSRRYVPAAQEFVVGIVLGRSGEAWRVDIGAAHAAMLDGLAFEGATKRSKPQLKVGALVYARVSLAHKDMDPELECFDAQTRKAEGFGELKGGFLLRCSLQMCRCLLDSKHFLFPYIGSRFPFEAAIGTNGRVWINAKELKQTIAITRCIEAVDPDRGGMDQARLHNFFETLDV